MRFPSSVSLGFCYCLMHTPGVAKLLFYCVVAALQPPRPNGAATRIDAKLGVMVDSQQTTALAKVSGSSAVVAKAGA